MVRAAQSLIAGSPLRAGGGAVAAFDLASVTSDLAGALRLPVVLLLFAALLLACRELGSVIAEWWQRRKRASLGDVAEASQRGALPPREPTVLEPLYRALVKGDAQAARSRHRALVLERDNRVERARLLVRVGPGLGLAGTLIPLGPALDRLGRGDVAGLARELEAAFGMTVLGVVCGMVGFCLALLRSRFYAADEARLEAAWEAATGATASSGGDESRSPQDANGHLSAADTSAATAITEQITEQRTGSA